MHYNFNIIQYNVHIHILHQFNIVLLNTLSEHRSVKGCSDAPCTAGRTWMEQLMMVNRSRHLTALMGTDSIDESQWLAVRVYIDFINTTTWSHWLSLWPQCCHYSSDQSWVMWPKHISNTGFYSDENYLLTEVRVMGSLYMYSSTSICLCDPPCTLRWLFFCQRIFSRSRTCSTVLHQRTLLGSD